MRDTTLVERRRLYLGARLLVKRHYRRELTLGVVARALACSPRQLQRAYAQHGCTFHEDLRARRLTAAAELLAQPHLRVEDVARLVGYSEGAHLARAFRRRYGWPPEIFRERTRNRP